MLLRLAARLRGEEGGVIVLVGLLMPFILGLTALVIEVGSWYTHRRHLQTQVDAAALAGGALFGDCLTNPSGADAAMQAEAAKYAGGTWNQQVGGTSGAGSISVAYGSQSYAAGAQPPDDTATGSSCDTGMFDVKATEQSIPHIFAASPLATVRAHARVELKQVQQESGLLPIAVPDVRLSSVSATFVDESTGSPPAGCAGGCTVQLSRTGSAGSQQLWAAPAGISVPISSGDLGVRIRVTGGSDPTAPCGSLYVECYDAGSPNGVVHIRGFDPSSAGPAVRNAWLLPGTCAPDAYFATADCSAGIQAEVDLGATHPLSGGGASAQVTASVDGGSPVALTAGSGGSGLVTWSLASGLAVIGAGPHAVTLAWSWRATSGTFNGQRCTAGKPCTDGGSFGSVQRAFVAGQERSGPLQRVQVYEQGVSTSGADSFARGTTHVLGVSVAAAGVLTAQSLASDPLVVLRVTGSQNQSIDCDPSIPDLALEIAQGCGPAYAINPGTDCPAYNQLWSQPQPWSCVKTQTGGAVGQVERGLSSRILGGASTCTAPIRWPDYSSDDPRIVPLIITPFGTFSGNGNAIVPVIDFGAFYVMGWNGDPCPGAAPVAKGWMVGHFIKLIRPNPTGSGSAACPLGDPSQITPCVPVMTR